MGGTNPLAGVYFGVLIAALVAAVITQIWWPALLLIAAPPVLSLVGRV